MIERKKKGEKKQQEQEEEEPMGHRGQEKIDQQIPVYVMPDYARPVVQNVVGTMNLGCQLELTDIYWKAKNAQYNPNRFAAVIMRLQKPKTTALIFRSGKMVITGAKSESDCSLAGRKYAKIINKIIGRDQGEKKQEEQEGVPRHSSTTLNIQNVVASSDVKFPIHLDQLQLDYQTFEDQPLNPKNRKQDKVQYQPQVFPGLVYRMKNPKVTFLIFVSGKIVVTGAKSEKIINQSFFQIFKIVQRFKKGTFLDKKKKAQFNPNNISIR